MEKRMDNKNTFSNSVPTGGDGAKSPDINEKNTTLPVENSNEVSQNDLAAAFTGEKPAGANKKADKSGKAAGGGKAGKSWIVMLVLGICGIIGGGVMAALPFLLPKAVLTELVFPAVPSKKSEEEVYYSKLTGLQVASAADLTSPAYCIQTPNGTDGARPQAGLNQAGVVFEAIAEAGITRFAAIYQAPSSAVIGPLRSLRIYYLDWDTPFDCTIVHAGGAPNALEALQAGGYKDLSENYAYMYRGDYPYYNRLWNNLFTNSTLLNQFAADSGYTSSNIKGFARMTPKESLKSRVDNTVAEKLDILQPATENTSQLTPKVTHASMIFGGYPDFNVNYDYDVASNSYRRSYGSGELHENYVCPEGNLGEVIPEGNCTLTQISPSVVVAMSVNERLDDDNYHQVIETIGSGDVVIFQNGLAIRGRWHKDSVAEQLYFTDENGAEIRLAPGQTFVEAVPGYGAIEY